MKKRFVVLMLLTLALVCLCATSLAATDPIKVSMQLSTNKFTGVGETHVAISVSNSGDSELPGAMTLYYPDGTQVAEFGEVTLGPGNTATWEGNWTVTQEQLESGRITFKIKYAITGDAGEAIQKTKNFSKQIVYTGGVASLEVNRTITPTTAANGQKVSITYDIVNTGTLPVSDVVITEDKSISSKNGTIASIAAGEKASYTFTATMAKKNLTSKSTITYTASGRTQTINKEAATIKYGDVKLKAALTADKKGGFTGETVKLTVKLVNSGKTDYTNVTVSDPVIGDIYAGQTVKAGETVTLEHDVIMAETQAVQFTVHALTADGDEVETATERLTLTSVSADQVVNLQVEAVADHDVVYLLPGIVKFKVSVTNLSAADVKNVSVSASGVTLYTFPTILPGETRDFTRDVSIQMAGQYQFVASVRDQLNQTQTFNSNIIYIAHQSPTPVPTKVPLPVPTLQALEMVPTEAVVPEEYDMANEVMGYTRYIFMVPAIIGLLLLVVAAVGRIYVGAFNRKRPEDRIDLSSVRNYLVKGETKKGGIEAPEQPAPEKEEPKEEEKTEEAEEEQDLGEAQLIDFSTPDKKA